MHDTRGREAPEGGVIVNGYSTNSHDISVLCHQQFPPSFEVAMTRVFGPPPIHRQFLLFSDALSSIKGESPH